MRVEGGGWRVKGGEPVARTPSTPPPPPPPPHPPRRPLVSVCIVNWNCRELLVRCLRSLRSQLQRVRLEVIVVDNGSTDGVADHVAAHFPHVTLLRNPENGSFARANNQAARIARG